VDKNRNVEVYQEGERSLAGYSVREILQELSHRCRKDLYTNHVAFSVADICEDLLRTLPEPMLRKDGRNG